MGAPNPADLPVKRKRGRPRKDENLVKKENSQLPATPASDGIQKIQQTENQINDIDDGMVGRVVSGVIEGTFDAGYFLCVRIGNSSTLLRGVVFQPEQVTPITAASDVAPHAQLYKRRDVPIPVFNPQSQVNGSILQPVQNIEQPVQLENQAPVAPDQVLPPELPPGGPFALNNQSATVVLPLTNMPMYSAGASLAGKITPQQKPEFGFVNQSSSVIVPLTNMSKNDAGTSLGGGKVVQQQIPEFRFENQSASSIVPLPNMPNNVSSTSQEVRKVILQQTPEFGFENQSSPLLKNLKMVEQDEVMQVFEVPASEPMIGIFSCSKTSNQLPQVQIQAGNSELVLDQTPSAAETQFLLPEPQMAEYRPSPIESVHNELKSSDLELHHTPVVTESQLVPVESQYVDSGVKSSEFVHKKLDNSNLELNQPIIEPMDIVMERPISPTNDSSRYMQLEKDLSKDETSENGDPVNDVADTSEAGSQPILRTEEAVPYKLADESGFPGRTESQISNSSGHTTDMDFVLGNAIPPTQSHC